ncbi:UDP-N-acetylmuramoyl-tripeptide--D-alanyl-D-alanine ligase [Anoxybacillus flavithermus]|uniref:UDP-N-acetylmuramoyl-tripeptide--D-alanyl-D- alanine ligase n=1 Tax=Anoxybacillus flavithermus TaxID=33934 RepID=UPI0007DA42C6|nr:UDP-N-acetylmuramoyl-tripeptide--D-alanyl-D-alanine ligase [Anoxybacillus flavithermus]MBE2914409.1 UDP-N-acetylmuramoyl-tripeptide--D-alanyl-D-alanine ligase [Anoxybacillus flavithermus]MBE2941231.1 UDP-N-acetylmuramoyl-tripeptide--D-alanyl-D-alanine ligase [Anoxybacillus flavithermus]MBE2943503.1 UDP-N-acetylmuramoyl-tripeptide--D-alanyl-D-alanine ligase [Anoxybacillus flavithermus]MBE2951809.1 UDP-N-acetylmuramoyl-tripeptide--D-alanyl-D-alanine ligase [Anoxybacillus flavithermus]MBE29544
MITRSLANIQTMIPGSIIDERYASVMIHGVSTDTRTIAQGNVYVPLKGATFNGHHFVREAFDKGAAAALWSKHEPNAPKDVPLIFVDDTLVALQQLAHAYRKQLRTRVIGVTGSNGKTTTKDMIASLLGTLYRVQKTEGNLNNHIGVPLTLLRLKEDTEYAVVEMGMSGFGEIDLLSTLAEPDVAVITNIGESHLQELGSREGIATAKFEIVKGLQRDGLFIYHGDEPLLQTRVENANLSHVQTFGMEPTNDYYPLDIRVQADGTTFKVNRWPNETFRMPLLGRHHVMNALAAIAVARFASIDVARMKKGFSRLTVTKMRTEVIKRDDGVTIINDAYNASPTSMRAALELLGQLTGYRKKIAIVGDMLELGEQEIAFHEQIGEMIDPQKIDYVLTYGERAKAIAERASERFRAGRVRSYDDKRKLAADVQALISAGDVILLKASRGMKLEEIISLLNN